MNNTMGFLIPMTLIFVYNTRKLSFLHSAIALLTGIYIFLFFPEQTLYQLTITSISPYHTTFHLFTLIFHGYQSHFSPYITDTSLQLSMKPYSCEFLK